MLRTMLIILTVAATLSAQDFVGANSCKMCHKSTAKGNQFGAWEGTPHAKALETLKGDEALAIAKEKGLKVPPLEAAECLACHTTGHGTESGYQVLAEDFIANPENTKAVKKNNGLAAVTCESCHGAGSKYKSMKVMKAIFAGETDAADVGLTIAPDEEACKGCHNEKSPTYKAFDFKESLSKISHPYPDEIKATRGH